MPPDTCGRVHIFGFHEDHRSVGACGQGARSALFLRFRLAFGLECGAGDMALRGGVDDGLHAVVQGEVAVGLHICIGNYGGVHVADPRDSYLESARRLWLLRRRGQGGQLDVVLQEPHTVPHERGGMVLAKRQEDIQFLTQGDSAYTALCYPVGRAWNLLLAPPAAHRPFPLQNRDRCAS